MKSIGLVWVGLFFSLTELLSPGAVQAGEKVLEIPDAVSLYREQLEPGSLIMHEGDCLAVKVFTYSPYTHVAMALPDENGNWLVYDSANGEGVRKSALSTYLEECAPNDLSLLHPNRPFNQDELLLLRKNLEEQMGRPYAVRHHLTGNRDEGLHCSEYMTDTLMSIDLIVAQQPSRVSPDSLRQGLLDGKLYHEKLRICVIEEVVPSPPPADSWCKRTWNKTKLCFGTCYTKCRRVFLCTD